MKIQNKDIDLIEWIDLLKKDLSTETIRTREATLNAFFNWCIKKKIIDINPFIYIDRTKSTKAKLNFWTEEQFKSFLTVVNCETHKLIFTTLFYTGLRKGEFCVLNSSDININKINFTCLILSKQQKVDFLYLINLKTSTLNVLFQYLDGLHLNYMIF